MPLHIPLAPAAAERSVRTALHSTTPVTPRPPRLGEGALQPVLPLPVHRLAPVTGPTEPPRARLTGWRFLLARDGLAVGAAETMLTADGWAFSHFCEGPFIASSERAVRLADALPGPYQPRLLSVPELYMLTLWLHSDPGADPAAGDPLPEDLLMPLAPAPPGIAADRAVTTAALLPLLTSRLAPLGLAS
ncbi:hypothetical protein [Streptomyces litchfieldiae]|uniref:Secreted protein n=1 Tax=Streptomyces litchfieldiae TaxID=3075543 RepID=A0ABU2MQC8_9ACTN|nr:hypothetical protein [Streptomyces sp. DSM 44938]MDT0343837.1 hypothetical protein [Streptomyces sp. DSM 44938]